MSKCYDLIELAETFAIRIVEQPKKCYSEAVEMRVDEIWEEQKQTYGDQLFNGQIMSALYYDEHELVGEMVEYRYHMAQIHAPELRPHLEIKTVSVTGVTTAGDEVLIGLRSDRVAEYCNMYELAPSGGVDPEAIVGLEVNIRKQAMIELTEETGIDESAVLGVRPYLLAQHKNKKSYEFCVRIEVNPQCKEFADHMRHEYQKLIWVPLKEIQAFQSAVDNQMVALSHELIDYGITRS